MKNLKSIAITAGAGAILAGAAISSVAMAPAASAYTDPDLDMFHITGTVTGNLGVNVRGNPNTNDEPIKTMAHGEKFQAICKTEGQSVGGEKTWYGIPAYSEVPFYVSGAFVDVPDDFELPKC